MRMTRVVLRRFQMVVVLGTVSGGKGGTFLRGKQAGLFSTRVRMAYVRDGLARGWLCSPRQSIVMER